MNYIGYMRLLTELTFVQLFSVYTSSLHAFDYPSPMNYCSSILFFIVHIFVLPFQISSYACVSIHGTNMLLLHSSILFVSSSMFRTFVSLISNKVHSLYNNYCIRYIFGFFQYPFGTYYMLEESRHMSFLFLWVPVAQFWEWPCSIVFFPLPISCLGPERKHSNVLFFWEFKHSVFRKHVCSVFFVKGLPWWTIARSWNG